MSLFISLSLCGVIVFQQLLAAIWAYPLFGESEDQLPVPRLKRYNFITPNAWMEKWKKSGYKRSYKFSSPNAWSEKWKKRSDVELEKPNLAHPLLNTYDNRPNYNNICGNLQHLMQLLQVSQNTLNQLLRDCAVTDISKPECLSPERKYQLQELYDATKMESDIINWCIQQNKLRLDGQ